jgi:hypothetical protein
MTRVQFYRLVDARCRSNSFKKVKKFAVLPFPSSILKCSTPMANIEAITEVFDDLIRGTMSTSLVPTLEQP